MNVVTILLLASLLPCQSRSIDDIIDDHWRRLHADVLSKRTAVPIEPVVVDAAPRNASYRCVHDHVAESLGIREARRRGYLLAAAGGLGARSDADELRADFDADAPRGSSLKATPTGRSSFQPIRIYSDTTRLTSDPARACFSTGSSVKIGYPNDNAPNCNRDGQEDCWHPCRAQDVLDASLKSLLGNYVIPAMTDVFSSFLRVPRVSGNLKLSSQAYQVLNTCGPDVPISKGLVNGMGSGVANSDIYTHITARPARSDGTVASATSCNWAWDAATYSWGRTLAGQINFNPQHFKGISTSSFDFRSRLRAAIHEMTHALGFSSALYADYRNNDGVPYPQRITTSRQDNYNGGTKVIQTMISPRVAQFAREHFNCPSMIGMELEDNGASGTAGSHWERRTAGPEFMTGYINPQMHITALTMSLLEDTGFYAVDYSQAEPLQWGRGLGCGFATGRCERTWTNASGYFCSNTDRSLACSPEGDSIGWCNLQTNLVVPPYFRHFPISTWGGTNAAADYCTFTAPSTYCKDSSQTPSYGGAFGPTSTCFALNAGKSAGCFNYSCTDAGLIEVFVTGKPVTCPAQGGLINVVGAVLTCPPAGQLCDPNAYLSAWPRVASVAPTSASSSASFMLTITGSNFVPGRAYSVKLAKTALTQVTVVDATTITAWVGGSGCDGGIVDVSVVDATTGNSGVLFAGFSFSDCLSAGQKTLPFAVFASVTLVLVLLF
eukprot:TRINITY_DN9059_c0_g1_i1.p1 TRINITY_DN9059_c0_g1~~TRINITY_DN9059_c0_g1_i1.p1  ORF type:complete len:722 (-),score=202.35 TRINITY_DN9059_c0_g1_i1:178-2343(-)